MSKESSIAEAEAAAIQLAIEAKDAKVAAKATKARAKAAAKVAKDAKVAAKSARKAHDKLLKALSEEAAKREQPQLPPTGPVKPLGGPTGSNPLIPGL